MRLAVIHAAGAAMGIFLLLLAACASVPVLASAADISRPPQNAYADGYDAQGSELDGYDSQYADDDDTQEELEGETDDFILDEFNLTPQVLDLDVAQSVTITVKFQSVHGLADFGSHGEKIVPSQAVWLAPDNNVMHVFFVPSQHQLSGDEFEGFVENSLVLSPWNTPRGVYRLQALMLFDVRGQQGAFDARLLQEHGQPVSFLVSGGRTDRVAPLLLGLAVSAARFESVGGAPVVVTLALDILEAGSGLALNSPENAAHELGTAVTLSSVDAPVPQWVTVHFNASNATEARREQASGAQSYKLRALLPPYGWPGQWRVSSVVLVDEAGNVADYTQKELAAANFVANGLFFVGGANLTYHGDDIFHFVHLNQGEEDDAYEDDDDYYNY